MATTTKPGRSSPTRGPRGSASAALHEVGHRVERRGDLHRPGEQVARHEVRRQEQQREEDEAAELVAAALRVLSAISCMKPEKTTAHSAVSRTSSTKPSAPLAIVDAERHREEHDRHRDQQALDGLGDQPADDERGARDRRGAQLVEVAALDVLDEVQRRRAERRGEQQRAGSWNAP